MNPPANAVDMDSIPGSGTAPEGGNDNPFQYSCLEKPMDRGAWWATVHEVAESNATQLLSTYACMLSHLFYFLQKTDSLSFSGVESILMITEDVTEYDY